MVVARRVRIANPGRRVVRRRVRVKRNPARRKLSAKQIAAGFGGKRRQASLARPKRRRRVNAGRLSARKSIKRAKSYGVSIPRVRRRYRAKSSATRRVRHRRKSNIGEIISIGLGAVGNPGRKHKRRGNIMARARRSRTSYRRRRVRRSNPSGYRRRRRNSLMSMIGVTRKRHTHRRRRSNPGIMRRFNRRRHYRRNPGGGPFGIVDMVKKGAYVLSGMVGTRYITQFLLQSRNVGAFGYGGNLLVAIIGGALIGKFGKNHELGAMFTIGGVTATVWRVLQDQTPIGGFIGQQLAGMGDVGVYLPTTFFTPLSFDSGGPRTVDALSNPVLPGVIRNQQAMISRGVGNVSSRYARGRYN